MSTCASSNVLYLYGTRTMVMYEYGPQWTEYKYNLVVV